MYVLISVITDENSCCETVVSAARQCLFSGFDSFEWFSAQIYQSLIIIKDLRNYMLS